MFLFKKNGKIASVRTEKQKRRMIPKHSGVCRNIFFEAENDEPKIWETVTHQKNKRK